MEITSKEIQDVVLDILMHFDGICKQNDLNYYLAYGTLLGSVRHQGFIPWDDDLDIWMPREDYNELCKLALQSPDEQYTLYSDCEHGDLPLPFQGKFVNKTLFCDRDKFGKTLTVYPWIDIFILDVYPHEEEKKYLSRVKTSSVLFNLYRLRDNVAAKAGSKGLRKLIFKVHDIVPFLNLLEKSENGFLGCLNGYKEGDMYFCFATVYMSDIKKCTYKREWFGKAQRRLFEGRELPCPCNADSILTRIYNEYMIPPPPEKRSRTHEIKNIREA